jgi:hypothetical protein
MTVNTQRSSIAADMDAAIMIVKPLIPKSDQNKEKRRQNVNFQLATGQKITHINRRQLHFTEQNHLLLILYQI